MLAICPSVTVETKNSLFAECDKCRAYSLTTGRAGRIRENMNRSSAYILGNTTADYSTLHSTPTTTRRPRDSSIGTLGRPNSAMAGHSTYHRDSSLTR